MAFSANLEMTDSKIAKLTLSGELDAASAGDLRTLIEEAASNGAVRLVFLMSELEYMASAGIRIIIFAKQKMGSEVDIYVIGAQETIVHTLTMTGLQYSVIMLDSYDTEVIENLDS